MVRENPIMSQATATIVTGGGKKHVSHAKTQAGIRRAIKEGRHPKHYKGALKKEHLVTNKQGKVVSKKRSDHAKKSPHLKKWQKFLKANRDKPVGTIVENEEGVKYKVISRNGMPMLERITRRPK